MVRRRLTAQSRRSPAVRWPRRGSPLRAGRCRPPHPADGASVTLTCTCGSCAPSWRTASSAASRACSSAAASAAAPEVKTCVPDGAMHAEQPAAVTFDRDRHHLRDDAGGRTHRIGDIEEGREHHLAAEPFGRPLHNRPAPGRPPPRPEWRATATPSPAPARPCPNSPHRPVHGRRSSCRRPCRE